MVILRASVGVCALLMAAAGPALAQSQSVIEETDRRMHELYDDSGCLRTVGCGDTASPDPHFGAMYLSPDGRSYGVGWDFQYAEDAAAAALESCGGPCRAVVETANACIAVVRSARANGPNVYFALDAHPEHAGRTATDLCINSGDPGCYIDLQACGGTDYGHYFYERETAWVGAHAMVGDWTIIWDDDPTVERPMTLIWPGAESWFRGTVTDINGDACALVGLVYDHAPELALDIECPGWRGGLQGEAALDASGAQGVYIVPGRRQGDFVMRRRN